MPDQTITPTVAAQVLHHYGRPGGYQAGSFIDHLIGSIARADRQNRALLALGFPGYCAAADLIEYTEGGVEQLQEIAASAYGGRKAAKDG
jgi:hypothetical protein